MPRPAPVILSGTRYTHLVTTGMYIPGDQHGHVGKIEVICDCGKTCYKTMGQLTRKNSVKTCSYKCKYYSTTVRNEKHKKVFLALNSKERKAWSSIKTACHPGKSKRYAQCGAKGITYDDSFITFEGFIKYIGEAPSKYHWFSRIDKEGNFEPGNVHWYCPKNKRKNKLCNT